MSPFAHTQQPGEQQERTPQGLYIHVRGRNQWVISLQLLGSHHDLQVFGSLNSSPSALSDPPSNTRHSPKTRCLRLSVLSEERSSEDGVDLPIAFKSERRSAVKEQGNRQCYACVSPGYGTTARSRIE
jgi:hypothetical protein